MRQSNNPSTTEGQIRKLSNLTIHEMTKMLTNRRFGDVDPSCVQTWRTRLGDPNLPFSKVFASIGTPMSDPTEEKQWRKLVQRAIFARNRDPLLTHSSRATVAAYVDSTRRGSSTFSHARRPPPCTGRHA